MTKKTGPITLIALLFSFLLVHQIFAGIEKKDEITIAVPAEVMAKVINDALPIGIKKEKAFSGLIWIVSVDRLKLGDDKVSFSIEIRGENLGYKGNIRETPLVLNFGDVKLAFDCRASIRFDPVKNILYVKPEINDEKPDGQIFVPMLAALTRGREFPVEIQKIKPFIAEFSNNSITINMDISNIHTLNNMLFIGMTPTVEKNPPVSR
jgi:hypothetical protein